MTRVLEGTGFVEQATTNATAKTNTGVSPLRYAPVEMTILVGYRNEQGQKVQRPPRWAAFGFGGVSELVAGHGLFDVVDYLGLGGDRGGGLDAAH